MKNIRDRNMVRFLLLTLLLVLAACGEETATPTPSEPDVPPLPSITPTSAVPPAPSATPDPDGYPSPPTGYPGPPTDGGELPDDPYPVADLIYVIQPVSLQCEPDSQTYADLNAALDDLARANVATYDAESVNLVVCQACGCPSSEHYRVQINQDALIIAEELGWSLEE